jgi:hypothetical protein
MGAQWKRALFSRAQMAAAWDPTLILSVHVSRVIHVNEPGLLRHSQFVAEDKRVRTTS